ncbi:hypothetical protein BT96DRAFT_627327 [Gymnopus androsaceus JB14]|uniref:Uncharacterized protein n=1 Tax=Gymnopus androsaceus JB14 TaxID=1447944 RepID=A0A6A4IG34_9AGAR|nr:hypothetical protein BT96DRAFT_627327 [Gymnopus androsaceus JB14]
MWSFNVVIQSSYIVSQIQPRRSAARTRNDMGTYSPTCIFKETLYHMLKTALYKHSDFIVGPIALLVFGVDPTFWAVTAALDNADM